MVATALALRPTCCSSKDLADSYPMGILCGLRTAYFKPGDFSVSSSPASYVNVDIRIRRRVRVWKYVEHRDTSMSILLYIQG